jgi:hypothetical protein
MLDRRRVELVDDSLPAIPHHHEAQALPLEQGVALVERVRACAERHSKAALDELSKAVPDIVAIALRECPPLPPTIPERLSDYRSRNVADWVMYRQALASAALARGWRVHWYDAKTIGTAASKALGADYERRFLGMRKTVGAPWNNDHRLALAAAIANAG